MSVFKCAICNTLPGAPAWEAKSHILWANQYGRKERIFCKVCGAWTDVRLIYASENGEQKTVVKQPTNPAFANAQDG